jgi:hypothetical protein
MLLRVDMSSARSSHLPQKGLGWVESGEEEEDLRREEGGEVAGVGRGGGGRKGGTLRGRGGRWHVTERIAQEIEPLDPTTVGVREGGEASVWIAGWLRRSGHN